MSDTLSSSPDTSSIKKTLFQYSSTESITTRQESIAKEIERFMNYICSTVSDSDLQLLTLRELEQMAMSIRLRIPNIEHDFNLFLSDLCQQGYLDKRGRLYCPSEAYNLKRAMLLPKVSINVSASDLSQSLLRYSGGVESSPEG